MAEFLQKKNFGGLVGCGLAGIGFLSSSSIFANEFLASSHSTVVTVSGIQPLPRILKKILTHLKQRLRPVRNCEYSIVAWSSSVPHFLQ